MKTCSRCGVEKPASEFLPKKGRCTLCRTQAQKAWRDANPERTRETAKVWLVANHEKKLKANRAWRAANPERHVATMRGWRAANRERYLAALKNWRAANPEKHRKIEENARARRIVGMTLDEMPDDIREIWLAYRELNQVRDALNKGRMAEPQEEYQVG